MSTTLLITGAANGIGRATAELAQARGIRVIRSDLCEGDVAADLDTAEGRAALVAGIQDCAPDGIDGVITCAGMLTSDTTSASLNSWGGSGIIVNAVAPGFIETAMGLSLLEHPVRHQVVRDMHPQSIGRYGRPEEVAELLLWLASPANSLMIGQVLAIDGGTEVLERGAAHW